MVLIQISYYFKSHHLTCLSSVLPFLGPEKHFLQKHFVSRDILTSGEGLRSASTCGHGADEQPSLSQTGFGRWKLLLFETLVKHYSRTDRPPLLPQHMTYVYTAITDLLGDYCCLQRITPNITHCLRNMHIYVSCRGLLLLVTSQNTRHLLGCPKPLI